MKTIRRNSKAIKAILTSGYIAKVYSLANSFIGEICKLDEVEEKYTNLRFATASTNNETITITIHSNLWYELTPEITTL